MMRITVFDPRDAKALVEMWRESFEHGVGVKDPHAIEEQVQYLLDTVMPNHAVQVAMHGDHIVGFIACNAESVAQLFVRVACIGQGIGSALLRQAMAQSSGRLWLYTFARNHRACAFYEHHGFVAVARGFEPSWQLDDVKYEWARGAATMPAAPPGPVDSSTLPPLR